MCYMDKSTWPSSFYGYRNHLAIETHAMKLPVHSLCADVYGRGGLDLCSYLALQTFMHYAPQNSANPHCNFMWSFTLWQSCWFLKTTQLTVNMEQIWITKCQHWHPITVSCSNSVSSLEWKLAKADCTWSEKLRGVAPYFCPHSVTSGFPKLTWKWSRH